MFATRLQTTLPEVGGECTLATRSGYSFTVHPASPDDSAKLRMLFRSMTPDDLRFRFLSALREVPDATVAALIKVDHDRSEHFLAFDPDTGEMVASAMLAGDPDRKAAEVAIAVHEDYKGRGIGWTLLEAVAGFARDRGFAVLRSIESHDNRAAIELGREMGFTVRALEGEPGLVVVEARLVG